jgi:hypothetical protein
MEDNGMAGFFLYMGRKKKSVPLHFSVSLLLKYADIQLRTIMMPLRVIFLSSYFLFFLAPLFCANVSVLVIETGLRDGRPVFYGEAADLWETGLMDVFFEEGHVVTNTPSIALAKKPEKGLNDTVQSYLAEAGEAGVDYFVLACLDYEAVRIGQPSGRPKPAGIEFNLFNINLSRCVWTQYIDLERAAYPKGGELGRARNIARSLIMHLGDSI